MKDYTLSEMREFCKKRSSCVEDCPLYNICFGAFAHMPEIWDDIEPRDMIELPYINEIDRSKSAYTLDGKSYEVVFRDDDGSIKVKPVSSKEAAKEVVEFLLQKKENSNE